MDHIDERTLELFVLGAPTETPEQIADHLSRCEFCQATAKTIRDFYAEVKAEMARQQPLAPEFPLARVRSDDLIAYQPIEELQVSRIPGTSVDRFRYFARRHPFVTGSGAFVAFAAVVFLVNSISTQKISDTNPASYRFEKSTQRFVVFNSNGYELWSKPLATETDYAEMEGEFSTPVASIADLNNDGRNEVVTLAPFAGESERHLSRVSIWDASGRMLKAKSLARSVHYKNREYEEWFVPQMLQSGKVTTTGDTEIFVVGNINRSPSILVRLDEELNELGTYWHFGHIKFARLVDLNRDGTKELIIGGFNDTQDSLGKSFAFVSVLDPSQIVRQQRATAVPEYRTLPATMAERYYIKIPNTRLEDSAKRQLFAQRIESVNEATLIVILAGTSGTAVMPYYEIYFSRPDMHVTEIKHHRGPESLLEQRAGESILQEAMTEVVRELQRGIEYWDGLQWTSLPATIEHTHLTLSP